MKMKFSFVTVIIMGALVLTGWQFYRDSNGQKNNLSQVKVAIVYQHIMDNIPPERGLDDVSKILDETKTDFILRAAFKWYAMLESFYEKFGKAVKVIKAKNPKIIICGSFGAQFIDKRGEYDPIKKKVLSEVEVEEMSIDLSKHPEWNLTQKQIEKFWEIAPIPEHEKGYFPDVTNKDFQELAINIAKRQINEGADAIWIDGLYREPIALAQVTGNPEHLAVKESFEGAAKIVEGIKKYAEDKGRNVYIGTWINAAFFPFPPPKFNFLTFSPYADEVLNMEFKEKGWDMVKSKVKERFGEIPIFVYLDYGMPDNTPLAVFSQKLSPNEQRGFLRMIDDFSYEKGMNFVYPLHGFYMGENAKILSFGKYPIYDSLAPEFQTYETIKELALKKKEKKGRGRR